MAAVAPGAVGGGGAGRVAPDPFVREPVEQVVEVEQGPVNMSICFEAFSVDLAEAALLRRKIPEDSKLYEEIVSRVGKGTAVQESFAMIRGRSGEKVQLETISEIIYPTEFDNGNIATTLPPQTPSQPTIPTGTPAPDQPVAPVASGNLMPPLGTAFETRNSGFTLEVEALLAANNAIVDLRIAPDFVTFADRDKWGNGPSTMEMPNFESQRMSLAVSTKVGVPFLLATPSRPPVSKVDADAGKRVWFAFVTVDLVSQ